MLWPLRIQSGGSSNFFLHQQELCCQVGASQSLPSLKLLISCGPSRATSSSDCKPFRVSLSSCGKVQVISVAFGCSTFSIFLCPIFISKVMVKLMVQNVTVYVTKKNVLVFFFFFLF